VKAMIQLLRRRGSVRTLLMLLVLALIGSTLFTLAALRPRNEEPLNRAAYDQLMTSRIRDWNDLLDWFYDQQEQVARIIPPGLEWLVQPGTPDLLVLDSEPLQKELASSKPAWLNSVPVWELELQENINGEITIRDGVGNLIHTFPAPPEYQIPYEALFRQSLNTYTPELNRYKLRSRISLLPQEFVEPYLYVQAEIEAYARQQAEPAMQMMMGGAEDELAISGMQRVTNGLRLTVSYPASFSGQVWSVYQFDTATCIATNVSGGSGGGTPPPPDGTNTVSCTNCVSCALDPTNSFNGLESAWALCFNNLILTGETSTSWTDTQPMGSDTNGNPVTRFYGVGSNADPDNDELHSGFELFVSHTDEADADSDDDGLSDGWEVANGLNPNDGAGANGSSGDLDSDGLSNAEEQEAGTDPRVANPVHEVGPDEAVFEYRSAEVVRSKPGFVNFVTDTNGVDRRYLEFVSYGEVSLPYSMGDHGAWSCSRSVDPVSGTTPMPGDAGEYEAEREGSQWWNSVLNVDYQSTGTWWLASLYEDGQGSIPESFAWLGSCDVDDPLDADGADFYDSFVYAIDTYWRSEVAVTIQPAYRAGYDLGYSREDFLSNEYTTAMLTNHAWMMLADAPALTNLAWGTGWVQRITRTYAWEVLTQNTYYASAQTAATCRLPPNEAECGLARTGYRLRIPTQSGVVSRVRVVEWFAAEEEASTMNQMSMMSEGPVPPVARTARVAVVLGTGSTQMVERSYFVIDPPTNKGVVFVGVLMVDIDDDGANTKFGFDDKTTPSKPWVCVEKFDSTKIKATVDPASVVDQIYFDQDDFDGEKFSFSPAQPTASPQSVTITGPGSEPIGWPWAEGTFYARAGCSASSCPVCDEMGIFVGEDVRPPTRYFVVSDPTNSATIPSPVPSDPNSEISSRWLQAAITPNALASVHTLQIPYDTDGDGKLDNTGIELNVLVEEAAQAIGLANRSAEPNAIWVFFVEDIHFVQSHQDQAVGGFFSPLFNSCFIASESRGVQLVSQIAAHEWGHAVSCSHVNDPFTGDNLMYPGISGIADFISLWSWREVER
jgi:hypothetical protein